ncbi:MAG TPA: carbon-nitrogen hydrolase family protein [Candidatus Hydrogenedentes bacterium]|nr:carbon-nitrogen hydrolase family protein [Candidatus Hydrogenedentota bacterium]
MKKKMNRRAFLAASAAGIAAPMAVTGETSKVQHHQNTEKDIAMNPEPLAARITLVQMTADADKPPAIERMPAFFEQAADVGSDLVVFPEYILGSNITPKDNVAIRFFELARKHHVNAITGCVEKHGADSWCTSAWVVNRDGNMIGRYLKSHPASGPAPHWWPPLPGHDNEARGVLGSEFKVFHLDFAPIGILQCYDGYFPEAFGCTSYMGAEIILWINGRDGIIEDPYCITAANCYGCIVGGVITQGRNTGFAGPGCVAPLGGYTDPPEEMRLYPRIKEKGDACVSAVINLSELRWKRKHLRTMHQRRPDMYGLLTQDVKMWQNYPEIPWDYPECADLVNKAQL